MPDKLQQGLSGDRAFPRRICHALGQFEARLERIPETRFNLALLGLYVAVAGATMLAHQMWRDEIQAWLIARDSHGLVELIHNLRYEGHPALWYLLLMALTRLSRDPVLMQGLQLAIASATVAVVLWRAPLSRLERLIFPFGYFVLFEYGVKSRSYSLGFLLLMLFCSLWRHRRKHPLLLAVLLAAMANVHAYFAILSAAALACAVIERIAGNAGEFSSRHIDPFRDLLAILIVAIGWGLAAAVALPPADSGYAAGWSFQVSGVHIVGTLWALGAIAGSTRWPAVIAGLAVLLFVLSRFRISPAAAAFLAFSTGGLLAFGYVKVLDGPWGHGVIFLALLASVWIDRARIGAGGARTGRSGLLVPPALLMAVLVVQAFLGLGEAAREFVRPYSNGSAVARYIRARGWEKEPIAAIPDYSASTIAGYLGADRIYYANGRRWGSFVVWDRKRLQPVDIEAVMQDLDQLGPAVTFIAAEGQDLNPAALARHRFRVAARFRGAVVADENYVIYRR